MTSTDKPGQLGWHDADGRFWSTFLDVPTVVRLKSAGYDIKDNDRLAAIFADSYDAADFAVEVHRPAWESAGLKEVDFLALMSDQEDRLGFVINAIVEGLIDFFLRFRDVLRAGVVRKAVEAVDIASHEVSRKLQSPKLDQAIQAELARRMSMVDMELDGIISGETSGDSLASSGSRPTVLPFARSSLPWKANASRSGTTQPYYSPPSPPNPSTPIG